MTLLLLVVLGAPDAFVTIGSFAGAPAPILKVFRSTLRAELAEDLGLGFEPDVSGYGPLRFFLNGEVTRLQVTRDRRGPTTDCEVQFVVAWHPTGRQVYSSAGGALLEGRGGAKECLATVAEEFAKDFRRFLNLQRRGQK